MTSKSFEVFEIEDVNFGPISRKLNFRIHLQFIFLIKCLDVANYHSFGNANVNRFL